MINTLMNNLRTCSDFLQQHMSQNGIFSLNTNDAEDLLVKQGIVERSEKSQKGSALRNIIRSNPLEFTGAYQSSEGSNWTIYNKRIIALRVAWMNNYEGTNKDDIPTGAGSFVTENKDGGEAYNFKNINGRLYGYARNQKDRNYKIEHMGANKDDDSIDKVTIIFISKNPNTGGQFIIGWYHNALFYRRLQKLKSKMRGNRPEYICQSNFKDAVLLPPDQRVFRIPNDPNHKPGQTNHWYFMGEPYHQINYSIWEYIQFNKLPKTTLGRKRASRPWQTDVDKRKRVELAAMDTTAEYFERRGFLIEDVSKHNVGWDLEASHDNTRLLLEVKGLSQSLGSIELTPNEYKHSTLLNYRLCILENALDANKLFHVFKLDKTKNNWISEEGLRLTITEKRSALIGL